MDWRPTSRSRSRPPESTFSFDNLGMLSETDQRYGFDQDHKFTGPSSAPAAPSMLAMSRRSPMQTRPDLPPFYDDSQDDTFDPASLGHPNHTSGFSSPSFAPSSLPSFGLHGMTRPQPINLPEHQRSFPRHVRKSSFDHTVAKDGITPGLGGRHQVNGKPAPDQYTGMKRRADAPHAESALRGDPADIDGMQGIANSISDIHDNDSYDRSGRSFPSSSFNFSYPSYDGLFDHGAPSNDVNQNYLGSPHSDNLTPAAAAASMAMAEGYASLSAANLTNNGDASGLDYGHFMGMVYPNMDNANNAYTHVDPTQIMSVGGEGSYPASAFQTSPSSDGWGNGRGSSTNASPEPYINSTASSPPSIDNSAAAAGRRKIVGLKTEQKKKASGGGSGASPTTARSATDSPDLAEGDGAQGKGSGEDGDAPPTLCTNCQTTNTPLWRRDPEGQPLCEYHFGLR
jgi:GATA-binding protein, other eukaryote